MTREEKDERAKALGYLPHGVTVAALGHLVGSGKLGTALEKLFLSAIHHMSIDEEDIGGHLRASMLGHAEEADRIAREIVDDGKAAGA